MERGGRQKCSQESRERRKNKQKFKAFYRRKGERIVAVAAIEVPHLPSRERCHEEYSLLTASRGWGWEK